MPLSGAGLCEAESTTTQRRSFAPRARGRRLRAWALTPAEAACTPAAVQPANQGGFQHCAPLQARIAPNQHARGAYDPVVRKSSLPRLDILNASQSGVSKAFA